MLDFLASASSLTLPSALISLEAADHAVIGIYFVVVVGVGLWFSRKARDSESFFLAGRNLTWPLIGLSLFATNISTEHLVGLAEAGYNDGLVWGGYEWMASYCLIMLGAVFAPQYIRHRIYTIPEYFEKRYGAVIRVSLTVYFLAMIILTKTTIAAYTGGIVIQDITGFDLQTTMWTIGLITAAYTLFGGLAAVVYTDAIQSIVLIGGSILMTFLALDQVGGWAGLETALEQAGKSDHLSMVRGPTDPNLPFTGYLFSNFLIGGMFYWCMDQVNVQRVLGARDVGHARAGAIFAGFLKIIPVFILIVPGVVATVAFRDEIGDESKRTYGVLVESLLNPGFRGLVLAALIAALMSSMSSTFNSAATIVSRDLVARFRPDTTVKTQVRFGQAALIAVMVIGIALAQPLVENSETIWQYLQEVTGYLSVPFAVVGLSGIFTRWANRRGAIAGLVTGIAASLFLLLDTKIFGLITTPYLDSFLHRQLVAAILAFVALAVTSRLSAERCPPPAEVAEGAFRFRIGPGPEEAPPASLLVDYRLWMSILFVLVAALWWIFR